MNSAKERDIYFLMVLLRNIKLVPLSVKIYDDELTVLAFVVF